MELQANRKGTITEYKQGHMYLSITEWEDGHCEIELHQCIPELLFHSCDKKDIGKAKELFQNNYDREVDSVMTMMDARRLLLAIKE
jgi:hypothetical protein